MIPVEKTEVAMLVVVLAAGVCLHDGPLPNPNEEISSAMFSGL